MTSSTESPVWVEIGVAIDEYFAHLGLPKELLEQFRKASTPHEPGFIWLSDCALMVHEIDNRLVVNRGEFQAILGKVRPTELPAV